MFAFFAWLGTAGAVFGVLLMLLAVLAEGRLLWAVLRREPVLQLALAFVLYVLVRTAFAAAEFPETTALQWGDSAAWVWLAFFFPVAWWLEGDTRRILLCLGLALAGFVVQVLVETDLAHWRAVLGGHRWGFGLVALMTGLLAGCGLLGLAAFAKRAWGDPHRLGGFLPRFLLWVALVLLLAQVLIATQSRGAWLATLVGLILLGAALARDLLRARLGAKALLAMLVTAVAIAAALQANWRTLESRVEREQGVFQQLWRGDPVAQIPYTSIGRRIHMWNLGLAQGLERPLFGWGPGSKVTRMFGPDDFEDPLLKKETRKLARHPHLHNTYLAVFVRLGLVGSLLLLGLFTGLLAAGWGAYRRGAMPRDLMLFLAAVLLANAVWGVINFRLVHPDHRHLLFLLAGAAYTYRLRAARRACAREDG